MTQLLNTAGHSRAMARVYFNMRCGSGLVIPDEDGEAIDDPSIVREKALEAARELLADAVREGRDLAVEAIVGMEEAGDLLVVVSVEEVLPNSLRARLLTQNG